MKRTKNISATVINEAIAIGGGIYRMNATTSYGYAFCPNKNNTEVNCGEFVFTDDCLRGNTGFICTRDFIFTDNDGQDKMLKSGNLYDMESGEVMPLR